MQWLILIHSWEVDGCSPSYTLLLNSSEAYNLHCYNTGTDFSCTPMPAEPWRDDDDDDDDNHPLTPPAACDWPWPLGFGFGREKQRKQRFKISWAKLMLIWRGPLLVATTACPLTEHILRRQLLLLLRRGMRDDVVVQMLHCGGRCIRGEIGSRLLHHRGRSPGGGDHLAAAWLILLLVKRQTVVSGAHEGGGDDQHGAGCHERPNHTAPEHLARGARQRDRESCRGRGRRRG